jgi:hypothetical protein
MSWLVTALIAIGALSGPASGEPPVRVAIAGSQATASERSSTIKPARYRRIGMPASAVRLYELQWGVDQMSVKLAESGQLVRFSYRVTDADKAKVVHEKASNPYLLDEKVHAVLQVPTLEKVGPLRQSGAPEDGKSYWMAFSNKGGLVRAGHRVSVVIGEFRVDGLVVQP